MRKTTSSPYSPSAKSVNLVGVVATALMVFIMIPASSANAQSCYDLWTERNAYFKEAGYCFKTPRAISYFGNAGCMYDDETSVPLSRDKRARIAEIKLMEQRRRCN